jgi:predicted nucleic acid-binding Zn ribbon protein
MNEPRICKVCGKPFFAKRGNQLTCSPECSWKNGHPKSPIQKKICPICGKEFESADEKRKYCSEGCADAQQRESKQKWRKQQSSTKSAVCPVCGETFTVTNQRRKYCSEECADVRRRENAREAAQRRQKRQEKQTMQEERECIICGKKFMPKVRTQLCCGTECSCIRQNRKRQERAQADRENVKKLVKTCPVCGKEFAAEPSYRKYCSKECAEEANRHRKSQVMRERYQREKAEKTEERKCVVCGDSFLTANKQRICCSRKCWMERYRRQSGMAYFNRDPLKLKTKGKRRERKRNGFSLAFWDRFGHSENMQNIVKVMHQCKAAGYENDYGRFVAEGKVDLEKLDKLEFVEMEEVNDEN